jgi:hypothetical protein
METEKDAIISRYEQQFKDDLARYLQSEHLVDDILPDCPDVAEVWPKVFQSYLSDAVREYAQYPTVVLGWMMYVGMAIAKYWDVDWSLYQKVDDLYQHILSKTDYDHLDDYICEKILLLTKNEHERLEKYVGECGARIYNQICHARIEPGTAEAYHCLYAALEMMYLFGAFTELKALGYSMQKIQ